MVESNSAVAQELIVDLERAAHGGYAVARYQQRVIFVRYGCVGERVKIRVTERQKSFWRAEVVSVIKPSPKRAEPPCELYGKCGGCDLQHLELSAQRDWKAEVLAEQFQRLAGIEISTPVLPLSNDETGLHWRTRMSYQLTESGNPGMYQANVKEIIATPNCLLPTSTALWQRNQSAAVVTEAVAVEPALNFSVAANGFWQPHKDASKTYVAKVLDFLQPSSGESCLDLYGGVGVFAAYLAHSVGKGQVLSVELDRVASRLASQNLREFENVKAVNLDVYKFLETAKPVDLVVLDPPRAGTKRKGVVGIAALAPRAIAYVACDPAALARDVNYFQELGYQLSELAAYDAFPMTHHFEVIAKLVRAA